MKVLLATDGSKHADAAVRLLARLPHDEHLDLTVLAVTPALEMHGSMEVVEWMRRSEKLERERAAENCERVERCFDGANATVRTLVVEGHAGQEIVSQAETLGVELIVVGSLGANLVSRVLLGSVSDFVATHARCSVLVVRPTADEAMVHRELKLCIADDESAPAAFAMEQLSKFKWGSQPHIALVNVLLSPLAYTDMPVVIDTAALQADMLKLLEERASRLKELSPDVTTHVVHAAHVGDGIVSFANQHQSDLIVAGNTGRGLLARFLMGSVSRYLLRHAPCSVWIARQRAE